jgi:hypothetical protein
MGGNRISSTLFAGGAVIIFGVLMLLSQFGMIPSRWFNFCAMVTFMLGVFQLVQAQRWGSRAWGLFLVFAGEWP